MFSITQLGRLARRGLVAVIAVALVSFVAAGTAGAKPPPRVRAKATVAAAATQDRSAQLPRTAHNEVVGDFLHRGYDQRMVAEDGNLVIYDPRGGAPISTPTDLQTEGGDFEYKAWFGPWREELKGKVSPVSLYWTPEALFMAGRNISGGPEHVLYRLKPDGSCAKTSCADVVRKLPGYDPVADYLGTPGGWAVTTSALAVGMRDGREVLAVGLTSTRELYYSSDDYNNGATARAGGVWLVDPTDLHQMAEFFRELPNNGDLTMVTALDWDDSGSGLLAIGVADGQSVHAVRVSGVRFHDQTSWAVPDPGSFPYPVALSVAVGHRPDGSAVFGYGYSDGSVKLWDPAVNSTSLLAHTDDTKSGGAVDAVTFVDRADGSEGLPDLVAVSSSGNAAQVLRYSGDTTLKPLPVAPKGGTSTDPGGIRAWFPGYKTGSVSFTAATSEKSTLRLDFATRPNAAYGCWSRQDYGGLPGLPSDTLVLADSTQKTYGTAALTAGPDGDCAATDFTGQWSASVVVTPADRPAERTVAKLIWSRQGELQVQSAGGSLDLRASRQADTTHPLGTWNIRISSPPAPSLPTKLTVSGKRLDPAGFDQPVYRFDVAATSWPLPPPPLPYRTRVQIVLPPLRVVGTTAAGDRRDLGLLVPQGPPARATSGTVTLSPVSFYWQNPDPQQPGGEQITAVTIEVVDDRGGRIVSPTLRLADIAVPAAGTTVGQVVVCPASGPNDDCANAKPVANGLDEAPLRIQISDSTNATLPVSDPVYGKVYYRDQDGELVTGLIPTDGSAYVRVSPYRGAFPNDGSTATTPSRPPVNAPVGGRFGYVSTTSTTEQELTAYVGGSTTVHSSPNPVYATELESELEPGGLAGQGFRVTGCSGDFVGTNYCSLAKVTATAPAPFLTSDPDSQELRIGLLLQSLASTSLASLPLQQVAGQPEHKIASNPLVVNSGEAHVNSTSAFQPADLVDTALVSHGSLVPIRALKVGGGN